MFAVVLAYYLLQITPTVGTIKQDDNEMSENTKRFKSHTHDSTTDNSLWIMTILLLLLSVMVVAIAFGWRNKKNKIHRKFVYKETVKTNKCSTNGELSDTLECEKTQI